MDFTGNQERIMNVVQKAKEEGGKIIVLPELCTSGYSCQDHFYENDTYVLSMDIIKDICNSDLTKDILLVLGTPVIHRGVRYNTMTFINNGKIILIRPKINLADDGNYREARWFNSWRREYKVEDFELNFPGQKKCPIGVAIVECNGCKIAAEVCEELWIPQSMNIPLYLNDTDIILNSSGSHFESKKIMKRIKLLEAATKRSGGAYVYANLIGCDGERLYFDGGSLIALNGKITAEEERFKLVNYQVLTENISLDDIRTYRLKGASIQMQSANVEEISVISIEIDKFINYDNSNNNSNKCKSKKIFNDSRGNKYEKLLQEKYDTYTEKLKSKLIMNHGSNSNKEVINGNFSVIKENIKKLEIGKYQEKIKNLKEKMDEAVKNFNDIKDFEIEEIVDAASCWLWDYLHRSGAAGFMLPLSGGADSASVALIVYVMSEKVIEDVLPRLTTEYSSVNWGVIQNLKKSRNYTSNEVCSQILDCVYLPNSTVSGSETQIRSESLATSISTKDNWKSVDIKSFYDAAKGKMEEIFNFFPDSNIYATIYDESKSKSKSKVNTVINYHRNKRNLKISETKSWIPLNFSLADENIQARLRMLLTYLISQIITGLKNQNGFKLNLACSNSDEVLIGYYTKYDASAGDLNPIGSLPKKYVNKILQYYSLKYGQGKSIKENLSDVLFETWIAIPTAELKPDTGFKIQANEDEIGLSYDQIAVIGELRSSGYGLLSIFKKLQNHKLFKKNDPQYLFDKISTYYRRYTMNRHKAVIVTPSVHLLPSPDDNRFDLRPFLYRTYIDEKIMKLIKPEKKTTIISRQPENNNSPATLYTDTKTYKTK